MPTGRPINHVARRRQAGQKGRSAASRQACRGRSVNQARAHPWEDAMRYGPIALVLAALAGAAVSPPGGAARRAVLPDGQSAYPWRHRAGGNRTRGRNTDCRCTQLSISEALRTSEARSPDISAPDRHGRSCWVTGEAGSRGARRRRRRVRYGFRASPTAVRLQCVGTAL